jgi:hypothetical protein
MSQVTSAPRPALSEFDAAKLIHETLQQLDKEQRVRAVRFASESLGVTTGVEAPSLAPAPAPPDQAPTSDQTPPEQLPTTYQDIRRFMAEKQPNSHVEFATAVAYFYSFVAPPSERKETVNATDLTNAARLVGRLRPKSPHLCLRDAKNAGILDTVAHGTYKINSVGENLVVQLPSGRAPRTQKRRSVNRAASPPKKPVKNTRSARA